MKTDAIPASQLQQLQILRVVVCLAQTVSIVWGYRFLSTNQVNALLGLLGVEWLVIIGTQWYLHRHRKGVQHDAERDLLPHLFIDVILLTALLYVAGGATNPFVSYYLVPIAISAATLSLHRTVFLALSCLIAYTCLLYFFQPLQVLSPHEAMMLHSEDNHILAVMPTAPLNPHLMGMWLNFGLSALLITFMVARMAGMLRRRELELANAREQQLQDRQLLSIASLAAGTVHELGTPLSTMAVLAGDLQQSANEHPALAHDAKLVADQVAACKRILNNLSRAAEHYHRGESGYIDCRMFLDKVIMHWQLLHPVIPLQQRLVPQLAGNIQADLALEQALIALLDNAAEASPDGIELIARLEDGGQQQQRLVISIRDHGSGITLDPAQVGNPFASTRGPGRGLGLFLSRAVVERLGGTLDVQTHPEGGTMASISLPVFAEPA